jgi:hypothetical protein
MAILQALACTLCFTRRRRFAKRENNNKAALILQQNDNHTRLYRTLPIQSMSERDCNIPPPLLSSQSYS